MSDTTAPDPDTVTATVKMGIGEFQLEAEIKLPKRSVPLRQMLPMINALTNTVVDMGVRAVEAKGETISCKMGCGACCRQLVPLAEVEVYRIRDLVNDLPEPRRTVIRERFAAARQQLETSGFWDKLWRHDELPENEVKTLGDDYFPLGIACPFLEDESCSIHPERPVSCREYLVTSPAENCSKPSADTIKMVPLPGKVWAALANMDEPVPGSASLRYVPLIQALAWTDAHPEQPNDRPGHEWVRELFTHLARKRPVPEQG
jgi:Fe-S-cluster containining protein